MKKLRLIMNLDLKSFKVNIPKKEKKKIIKSNIMQNNSNKSNNSNNRAIRMNNIYIFIYG